MLQIGKNQLSGLDQTCESRFFSKLNKHLIDVFPEKIDSMSKLEIEQLIKKDVNKARSFGFFSELESCLFLDLDVLLDQQFEAIESNTKDEILADSSLTAYEKVLRLHSELL